MLTQTLFQARVTLDDTFARGFLAENYDRYHADLDRRREIEAMKIEAYLGTVPRVLYYDADGNLLPARI